MPDSSAPTMSAMCWRTLTTKSRCSTRSPMRAIFLALPMLLRTLATHLFRAISVIARQSRRPWPVTTWSCTSPPKVTSIAQSSIPTHLFARIALAPMSCVTSLGTLVSNASFTFLPTRSTARSKMARLLKRIDLGHVRPTHLRRPAPI